MNKIIAKVSMLAIAASLLATTAGADDSSDIAYIRLMREACDINRQSGYESGFTNGFIAGLALMLVICAIAATPLVWKAWKERQSESQA